MKLIKRYHHDTLHAYEEEIDLTSQQAMLGMQNIQAMQELYHLIFSHSITLLREVNRLFLRHVHQSSISTQIRIGGKSSIPISTASYVK